MGRKGEQIDLLLCKLKSIMDLIHIRSDVRLLYFVLISTQMLKSDHEMMAPETFETLSLIFSLAFFLLGQ